VRYALEGSVRKAANRVRVTAQLIEAASGGHLWAERYDRDLTDIFAVQDEITASVSAAILPTMDRSERERAARKPPESLDAAGDQCFDLLLVGHVSLLKAGVGGAHGLELSNGLGTPGRVDVGNDDPGTAPRERERRSRTLGWASVPDAP